MSQTVDNPDADDDLHFDAGIEALQSSGAFRGAIEPLDGHHCNDHFALIYENQEEQLDVSAPFVGQGIERGERCLYVVDELAEEQILSAIRQTGVDADAAVESGALTFHTVEETYLQDGTFDPDEMIDFYAEHTEEAVDEYTGLRVVAETTWLQEETTSVEEFMEYEAKINRRFDDENSVALCMYDRAGFEPEIIRDVVRTHPHLIYDGTVCNNLYYTPPKEFFREDEAERDVERMLGTLVERTEAKMALREQQRYQRELYEVTSDTDSDFEEKVEQILDLGCERFGLAQGYISRYHPQDSLFETRYAVGPTDQKGGTGISESQPRPGQFCRQALDADEPAGAADVRTLDWEDDPVYREDGLRSYFGVKITDGSGPCGTLAFCDTEPRTEPFTEDEHTFLELVGQWVSHALEQRRREDQLAALNRLSRELMNAETLEEIADTTVEHAHRYLHLPLSAVVTYDRETGRLTPAAQTPCAEEQFPTASLCDTTTGPVWKAFVENELAIIETGEDLQLPTDDLTQLVAIPLDRQGVFITGTTTPGGFTDAERDFIETMAATVEAACTRTDREQLLHEREATLETQNKRLERLNRINTTIRGIDQALVQATTRGEIETVVCEQLADGGPYEFAWIGEEDVVTHEIVPRENAGNENGYLEEITLSTADRPTGQGPAERAIRTRQPQVVNDALGDSSFRPHRQAALNRGYHSLICLPLEYDDTLYGILTIYAGQPGVFDELERAVLTEMADTIAYAINAVESKKALVSDEVTELEFTVEDAGLEVLQVARTTGGEYSLEALVPQSDGRLRGFFSTRGVTATAVRESISQLPVTDLRHLAERTDDDETVCLFAVTLGREALSTVVLDHGAQLDELEVTAEAATVTVQLAGDARVREFVEMFQTKYPDSTLTAQRTRQRTQETAQEFRSAVIEALTDRQREVLQTAYFSGYFEEPRVRTAREIAETLDITQPTFNSHTRAAQRKIYGYIFEENSRT